MLRTSEYELIDFGEGRKLERFGPYVLDRPAPQAQNAKHQPAEWSVADARFCSIAAGQQGEWSTRRSKIDAWTMRVHQFTFELRLTPFGQVGIFPEQADIWHWITESARHTDRPRKVLNLFAYTGASTLAAALAGADVVHVDSSRTAVAWARRNAERSGLANARIRWLVDDALTFVRREVKRANTYDGIIVDPPSFGRGPKGQVWHIEERFDELLDCCHQLMCKTMPWFVVTCHTTGWTPDRLLQQVRKRWLLPDSHQCAHGWLVLQSNSGSILNSGMFVRSQ